MSLLLGLGLVAAPGVAHHYGLMDIRFLRPKLDDRSQAAIVVTFLGILTLHSLRYSHLLLSTGCCWAGAHSAGAGDRADLNLVVAHTVVSLPARAELMFVPPET